jgi:hypothetical protein
MIFRTRRLVAMIALSSCLTASSRVAAQEKREHIKIRGVYGGIPTELLDQGKKLTDFGINAVFTGSDGINDERLALLRKHGASVFAEFNTMHVASYLKDHPEAAPIGPDGKVSPAPNGWQGVCPTHEGYRKFRMDAFRRVVSSYKIDGMWLDYHHSHASWEQAEPELPDTCFCPRCVAGFARSADAVSVDKLQPLPAQQLLGEYKQKWVQWRCDVFTDWVREFRSILDETRSGTLLGTFHCPWTDTELAGALRNKLAIDLKAQAKYIDVFSIMPYHARFGHAKDPTWISRQTKWLGSYLGIQGDAGERNKIWPIVQLSDWGEQVAATDVPAVLDHGTRRPATGVMVFNWGALRKQKEKVDAMTDFYRAIAP